MKNKELIGRISQKADILPVEAFEALAATFQALIDNLCGTVFTTISIAPDPESPVQFFVNVGNPPQPDVDVPQPTKPHVDVPQPTKPHVDVPQPTKPHVDVPQPTKPHVDVPQPTQPHLERRPAGMLAYVAGRVGIPSDKAAIAVGVIFEQINVVAREAGVRLKA